MINFVQYLKHYCEIPNAKLRKRKWKRQVKMFYTSLSYDDWLHERYPAEWDKYIAFKARMRIGVYTHGI
jgi:hypothetical protein